MELREINILLLAGVEETGRNTALVELGESGGSDACGRYNQE
jgi:mRNA degradation ribonuclease J1/J2